MEVMPVYLKIREPINSISHLFGACLSLAGLVFLLMKSIQANSPVYILASLIFGLSLILLYCASAIYHWVVSHSRVIEALRKIDHCMIYVLIAGTYTPLCLLTLKGGLGTALLIAIWGLAAGGIILKLVWFHAPRWLSTSFYLLLGWLALFFLYPISKAIPGPGILLLLLGGIFYSGGSIFYVMKSPKVRLGNLGFHEIFHFFILAGSITHYFFIYNFVLI